MLFMVHQSNRHFIITFTVNVAVVLYESITCQSRLDNYDAAKVNVTGINRATKPDTSMSDSDSNVY